ncbi:ThiF family adenylyltransferase [Nocardia caishijiensis]|uniref:ThiF family protein n=1 Tax=Nocardia caishijiensis TaxID=184756 RepID=A0ABQ6YP47_9NOCA|nr:ThiF family adenylyltransferase [Nocardia caishijiensis]KAF0847560.1 ThiF family protein [Nocardia caishijiensis]
MVSHRSVPRPAVLTPGAATTLYRPLLFDASSPDGLRDLEALAASGAVDAVHDTIEEQLDELIRSADPSIAHSADSLATARHRIGGGIPLWQWGTWVFYPWSGRLVHVLPREDFQLLRTDRNRTKIDRAQQRDLRGRRIGVVGLSVGNSAAVTLAMEGVGGSFRLADFDTVGLSNLNRLRAGVDDLGVAKAALAARQMYEIDPYLDIEIFTGGLTEESIGPFFDGADGGEPLDLLVEECDTVWAKVAAREYARGRGIPVLMDANDRGLLDVERFDLEPDRPLLHGRIGAATSADVARMNRGELLTLLLTMVDEERLSPAMRHAIGAIGTTLSSWPQLASGVMLGGALVADTARRILLGELIPSGRTYVDLDELVPALDRQLSPEFARVMEAAR